jgi:hypothetical protein
MEEPQCAQCHRRIDPIGYGLEHFTAAGLWRGTELTEMASGYTVQKSKEHPIDDNGTLPDGTGFHGFFELRDAIAAREQAFLRGLTEHLIAYGLARPISFTDDELCAGILRHARKQNSTFAALVIALVTSREFRSK